MGPSGSGKTTLAKLAVRLYDPQQGTVLYDRADVSSFRMADLRRFCALVNQEPVVFSGSIADNISYGSDVATPQSVSIAARYAQIEPFIEQLPQQYRTLTQERGLTLSGGQKQRLNLARALHADPLMRIPKRRSSTPSAALWTNVPRCLLPIACPLPLSVTMFSCLMRARSSSSVHLRRWPVKQDRLPICIINKLIRPNTLCARRALDGIK
jgi:ATP-binding cassette subfamily B protein